MPLVTSTEMFKKAYDGGYAIGAFNVNNMEIVQGITEACREEKAPVILQVSKGARAYANHTYLVKLVEAAVAECPEIPIVLHLDHGPDFETCKSCIDGGFTSVMIDASSKPFAENIEITRKVVEYAHDHGVVVEAELGTLAGIEDDVKVAAHAASYTRPERSRSSSPRPAATPWPSPSAPATALTSSPPSSAPVMRRASWFPLRCASTCWRKCPSVCRLPHRSPRLLFRAPELREDDQRERRQDARCRRHPRRAAASRR